MDKQWVDKVLACINPEDVYRLALDLCKIPSSTGEEGEIGQFVVDWFRSHGLRGIRQEVEAERANAIGILHGEGTGPALMFNGHMDTSAPIRHQELAGPIPPRTAHIAEPYIEDGILYGTGMDNMKSGLAAIMSAARAIKVSGVHLKGDLIVAGVVGEIGRAQVDQYQGRYYRGKGIGTRYLLTHGVLSDYAIVADASHFGLTWAQCGAVYAKITVPGKVDYTPYTERASNPHESSNAVIKMTILIDAFERWAAEYERRNIYRFSGGEIRPKVSIGAIAGGVPFKVSNSPQDCSLYVDIRTPPGMQPIQVQRELRMLLDSLKLDYELEIFTSKMGYEGKGVGPLVDAIRHAHELVVGKSIRPISPGENSMWTDTNLYNELGIPAVKFGIGAALKPGGKGEIRGMTRLPLSTSKEDLLNATKIYAVAGLSICGIAE